jgi:hypothetical protein
MGFLDFDALITEGVKKKLTAKTPRTPSRWGALAESNAPATDRGICRSELPIIWGVLFKHWRWLLRSIRASDIFEYLSPIWRCQLASRA